MAHTGTTLPTPTPLSQPRPSQEAATSPGGGPSPAHTPTHQLVGTPRWLSALNEHVAGVSGGREAEITGLWGPPVWEGAVLEDKVTSPER